MSHTPSSEFEGLVLKVFQTDTASSAPPASHPDLDTLLDYQIGALPPFEQAIVDAHILRCHQCRELVSGLSEKTDSMVRELCGQAPSWSFSSWFVRTVQPKRTQHFARRLVPTLAAAACSLGFFVAGLLRALPPAQQAIPRDISAQVRWDLIGLFASGLIGLAISVLLFIRRKR